MTEYNEGDLVEAVKGDTVIRGRLVVLYGVGSNPVIDITLPIKTDVVHLKANGYKVTVIEKAAPKVVLPSEPGHYLDKDSDVWALTTNGHGDPEWHLLGGFVRLEKVVGYAPFTKLEPVSETAKKVLDAVRHNAEKSRSHEFNGKPVYDITEVDLEGIGEEFGVTS